MEFRKRIGFGVTNFELPRVPKHCRAIAIRMDYRHFLTAVGRVCVSCGGGDAQQGIPKVRQFVARVLLTLLLSFQWLAQAASDVSPTTEIHVKRIDDYSGTQVHRPYDRKSLLALSRVPAQSLTKLAAAERAPRPYAHATDVLDIKAELLLPPAKNMDSLLVGRVPPEFAHTTLALDGVDYILHVVDQTYDPKYRVRHVMAAIINAPGYARFTIDDDAGSLAGTAHTPKGDYRIISAAAGGQIAYRLTKPSETPLASVRYLPVARRSVHADASESIEQRHRQIELLSDLQPTYVRTSPASLAVAVDGSGLGKIDIKEISGEAVRILLSSLGPLTLVDGTQHFEVMRVHGGGEGYSGGYAIVYRQTIGGVPVAMPREIRLRHDGVVESVSVRLADPSFEILSSRLDREAAAALALEAVSRIAGQPGGRLSIASTELTYRIDSEQRRLVPTWTIGVDAEERGGFSVGIDAVTGAVSATSTHISSVEGDFGQYDSCGPCDATQPQPTQPD